MHKVFPPCAIEEVLLPASEALPEWSLMEYDGGSRPAAAWRPTARGNRLAYEMAVVAVRACRRLRACVLNFSSLTGAVRAMYKERGYGRKDTGCPADWVEKSLSQKIDLPGGSGGHYG